MAPSHDRLPVFTPAISPRVWAGPSSWLLMNKAGKRDGMSLLRLGYLIDCDFCLAGTLSGPSLARSDEASCLVVSCPRARPMW